jgi:hypothetical protein
MSAELRSSVCVRVYDGHVCTHACSHVYASGCAHTNTSVQVYAHGTEGRRFEMP